MYFYWINDDGAATDLVQQQELVVRDAGVVQTVGDIFEEGVRVEVREIVDTDQLVDPPRGGATTSEEQHRHERRGRKRGHHEVRF